VPKILMFKPPMGVDGERQPQTAPERMLSVC
jgi:hypothetical protein